MQTRLILAVLAAAAALSGCISISTIETPGASGTGASRGDANRTRIVHTNGSTQFVCEQSASGKCHFIAFTRSCERSSPTADQIRETCDYRISDRFTLASGESRSISGLPKDLRTCSDTMKEPSPLQCGRGI